MIQQDTYSIEDLENLTQFGYEGPPRIANALTALGIKMYYGGKEADLSSWYPTEPPAPRSGPLVAVRGYKWFPDPDAVLVTRESLPPEWLAELEGGCDEEGWQGFDPEDPKYPRELDIAMLAWRAVATNTSGSDIKKQLREWIVAFDSDLSAEAVARIATVCNWNKRGGQRSSGD